LKQIQIITLCLLAGLTNADETNTPAVDVTAAVTLGVDYLRGEAAQHEDGWIFRPIVSNRIIGQTNATLRFKAVEVTIPGYKYETYETLVPGNSPAEPMRRETRSRVVGLDPSKDTKVTREYRDAKGPIERVVPVNVYERDPSRQWSYGDLGNNGLAIVALRRCGLRADDPLVATVASSLARVILTYGIPDNTHDLAGITAGFAVTPGDDYQRLTEQCAAKLMDAQITTGPASGLWGPVSTSPAMLSAFLKVLSRLADEKTALQKDLAEAARPATKGKPSAKTARIEEDIKRLDARMAALQEEAGRVTLLGLQLYKAFGYDFQGRGRITVQGDYLIFPGWPYLVHNQLTADLESTAEAIFALRIAFENGRLPAKTWRPDPPKPAGPGVPSAPAEFPPSRTAREVVELAAKAVTAGRLANGQWNELNVCQPVTDFVWLKAMVQVKPELFPKLPSRVTLPSVVRGAAVLANIQTLQTGQARVTALENPACQPLFRELFQGKCSLITSNDVRSPYDALLQCGVPRNPRGKSLRTDFTAWNEVGDWLSRRANKTGAWGRTNAWTVMPSTSLMALKETIPPIDLLAINKNYDKPHLNPSYFYKGYWPRHFGSLEATYFTTAALMFLSDGLPEGWTPAVPAP